MMFKMNPGNVQCAWVKGYGCPQNSKVFYQNQDASDVSCTTQETGRDIKLSHSALIIF
jgi:hypothetical protein